MKLTNRLHLVPSSRKVKLYPHTPCGFRAQCLIKHRDIFTYLLFGGGWSVLRSCRFTPDKEPRTHWIGGCGPQNRCGRRAEKKNFVFARDSNSEASAAQLVISISLSQLELFLLLINHCALKAYVGVEIQLHRFIISTLENTNGHFDALCALPEANELSVTFGRDVRWA
jgi:hypothetical protein